MANSTSDDWKSVPAEDGKPSEWSVQIPDGASMTQEEYEATQRAKTYADASQASALISVNAAQTSEGYRAEYQGFLDETKLARDEAVSAGETSSANSLQTGQDRAQTQADRNQTGLDRLATAQDRAQTGQDRAAVSQDRTKAETARSGSEAAQAAAEAARDSASGHRLAAQGFAGTAQDAATTANAAKAATAADRVQTGQDRTATAQERAWAETAAANAGTSEDNAAASAASAEASADRAALFDPTTYEAHMQNKNNPHVVTAAQVGAYTTAQTDAAIASGAASTLATIRDGVAAAGNTLAKLYALITGHTGATNNPHGTTAAQVGADTSAQVSTKADAARDAAISTLRDGVAAAGNTLGKIYSLLTGHTGDTNNPHATTKAQVGLGSVDNTSDANKPVSTAQQTALNLKANLSGADFASLSVTAANALIRIVKTAATARTWQLRVGDNGRLGIFDETGNVERANFGTTGQLALQGDLNYNNGTSLTSTISTINSGKANYTTRYGVQSVAVGSGTISMTTSNNLDFAWSNGFYYRIDANSYVLINSSPSDSKLKRNIVAAKDGMATINKLKPVTFDFIDKCAISLPQGNRHGFIAQDVQAIIPAAVTTMGMPDDTGTSFLGLRDDAEVQMMAIAVKALQELDVRLKALENKILILKL